MDPRCRGARVGVRVIVRVLPGVPAVPVEEGVGIAPEAAYEAGALVVGVFGGAVVVDPGVDGIAVAPVGLVVGFWGAAADVVPVPIGGGDAAVVVDEDVGAGVGAGEVGLAVELVAGGPGVGVFLGGGGGELCWLSWFALSIVGQTSQ